MSAQTKNAQELRTISTATSVLALNGTTLGRIRTPHLMRTAMTTDGEADVADLDQLRTPGFYQFSDNSVGTFPGSLTRVRWAVAQVFVRTTDVYQRIIGLDFIAIRRGSINTPNWTPWREVTLSLSPTQ
ncbi:MAG: hypothetical protein K2M06_02630 [Muribaculaceae bacterium]|nr:hypothetical protein [Muribaculaceae bacterium]